MDIQTQISRLDRCGVVPVITLPTAEDALPLAEALLKGGLDVIEVTLRSDCALEGVAAIAASDLDMVVGVGTVLQPQHVEAAEAAKADFLVTPGTATDTLQALQAFPGLVLPGVSTVSEALQRQQDGFDTVKFFPAEAAGGAPFLKAIQAPIPDLKFMPTGGVSPDNLADYLKLGNVIAAGGSWIAPKDLILSKNWREIENRAKDAADKVKSLRLPG